MKSWETWYVETGYGQDHMLFLRHCLCHNILKTAWPWTNLLDYTLAYDADQISFFFLHACFICILCSYCWDFNSFVAGNIFVQYISLYCPARTALLRIFVLLYATTLIGAFEEWILLMSGRERKVSLEKIRIFSQSKMDRSLQPSYGQGKTKACC